MKIEFANQRTASTHLQSRLLFCILY